MKKCMPVVCMLLFLAACGYKKKTTVIPAFYHWKSYFTIYNEPLYPGLDVQRMYVKWMDVDWSPMQGAVPIQVTQGYIYDTVMDIVPVIYITNSVFLDGDEQALKTLADHIVSKVKNPTPKFDLFSRVPFRELQIDVDWTGKSRDRYFSFLKYLKSKLGSTRLSATIRLYQYKYRTESGIPPVDRGMVMLYNMTSPREFSPANSIIDVETAKSYLISKKYPIPVDIALPLFSWGIAYRNDKFLVLLNDLDENKAGAMGFLQKNDWYYDVTVDTVYQGNFLRRGDKIKIENTSSEKLLELADAAQKIINDDTTCISIFDWDTNRIKQTGHENIEAVYSRF